MKEDATFQRHVQRWLGDSRKAVGAAPQADMLTSALDALYAAGPGEQATRQALTTLRRALSRETEVVYYGSARQSPLGSLYVAVSQHGLFAVDFGRKKADFLARLKQRTSANVVSSPDRADAALRQVKAYLEGRRRRFDLPVDLSGLTDFQCRVLWATSQVPRGQMATYAEIAQRIGKPGAARAVGQALAHNPVPVVIPCHRIVASDGSLTGYSSGGGVKDKAKLLKLEGALLE